MSKVSTLDRLKLKVEELEAAAEAHKQQLPPSGGSWGKGTAAERQRRASANKERAAIGKLLEGIAAFRAGLPS